MLSGDSFEMLKLHFAAVSRSGFGYFGQKEPPPPPPLSHEVNWRKYGNGEGIGVMLLSKGWGRCDFEIWSGLMGVDWILPPFSFTASFHSHTDRAAVLF